MAKPRPFSKVTNRRRLTRQFAKNKKLSISPTRRIAFKRRRLRLITRARLAAAKLIPIAFRNKKKRKAT